MFWRNDFRRAALIAASAAPLAAFSAPASADVLAPIWTGAYLGFHGGANWSDVDTDFSKTLSSSSFAGGAHAGFNLGLGGVLVGVEVDANLDSAEYTFSSANGGNSSLTTDWSGTIRGRVGLPIGPALFYATAGYAWTDLNFKESGGAGGTFSGSHTFNGVVYGLGAESFILPNMSVRLEALRYDYSADKLSLSGATGAIEEFDPSETVVRAGVTFHLN